MTREDRSDTWWPRTLQIAVARSGLSVGEIADGIGVSKVSLTGYLRGQVPKMPRIRDKMASMLSMSAEEMPDYVQGPGGVPDGFPTDDDWRVRRALCKMAALRWGEHIHWNLKHDGWAGRLSRHHHRVLSRLGEQLDPDFFVGIKEWREGVLESLRRGREKATMARAMSLTSPSTGENIQEPPGEPLPE